MSLDNFTHYDNNQLHNNHLHNAVNSQRCYVCISKANLSIRINRNIIMFVTLANLIFAINIIT